MAKKKTKRLNTYFRQTARAFKAARQTSVFAKVNRNIPYKIFNLPRRKIQRQVQKINSLVFYQKQKYSKKVKSESKD